MLLRESACELDDLVEDIVIVIIIGNNCWTKNNNHDSEQIYSSPKKVQEWESVQEFLQVVI